MTIGTKADIQMLTDIKTNSILKEKYPCIFYLYTCYFHTCFKEHSNPITISMQGMALD